ncbi:MAG: hypothetical protein SPI09_00325 [Candidatus Limivicinus sp.]|nr:hypothetical protein [Clostridiales bacterium]MDY6131796.1 hypothetical protein [Candidatus Limivicinus sp.]
MARVFEDEFMDLQADYVSLCLEVMEGIADEIYIYISNEEDVSMFHTFCRVKGQVKTLGKLFPATLQRELLMTGGKDIEKINELCRRYGRPAPTEIRLHYVVKTNSLDAHYEYKPVCAGDCGFGPGDVVDAWIEEERKKDTPQMNEKKSPWASWKK